MLGRDVGKTGKGVGTIEGPEDGVLDGDMDGLELGVVVDRAVGTLVGTVVGFVGEIEGKLVGLDVGNLEGLVVGFPTQIFDVELNCALFGQTQEVPERVAPLGQLTNFPEEYITAPSTVSTYIFNNP